MRFRDRFAARTLAGALIKAGIAFVLITPMVAAARIWWSGPAAAVVGVLAVTAYVIAAARYAHHDV